MGIFGKNLEKRLMFMITFCDGGKPQCLNALTAAQMPVNNYFKFNNSALMEIDGDNFTENFWNMGKASLKDFFNKISMSEAISLSQTKEVMAKRNVLMIRAQNIES